MQTPTDGVSTPKSKSASRNSSVRYQNSRYPPGSLNSARRRSFRTPARRKVAQSSPISETLDPQKAAFLLHRQWTLYSVTPMHNFSYSKLKDYSKHLSASIAAEKQKGFAFEVGTDVNLKATFFCLYGLKDKDRDPTAVMVQIVGKSQFSKTSSEDRVMWTGWFCGTCMKEELLEALPGTFTGLPLFLINGPEALTSLVGSWLQKAFDCCFGKLLITSYDLTWLAAMWASYEVHGHTSAIELVFSVPVEPHMDISYAIHPDDFKTLWNDIHKSKDEVTLEEVEHLFQCLYEHFFRHFRIHLSATQLVKVTAYVASAHCDGKVKRLGATQFPQLSTLGLLHMSFLSKDHLVRVLGFLTEIAINNIQY